ncbi:MAG: NlpC/P60 family protein, partial [Pseudomonadota bacterium]
MSDPRLTPANARVAAMELQGQLQGVTFTEGTARMVARPVVDLLRSPDGPRDRQLLIGDGVRVFEVREGVAFVQAEKDGYVGYLPHEALGQPDVPTHWVSVLATHLYPEPDFKRPELMGLSFGSRLRIVAEVGRYSQTAQGHFVPKMHLSALSDRPSDLVATAALFCGVPYLWGGNSAYGLDCSGLVQAAALAVGHPCPGDSDLQMATLGEELPPDTPPQRGDLLFFKGHVALVADADTLLHANAFHMATAYEPLKAAL